MQNLKQHISRLGHLGDCATLDVAAKPEAQREHTCTSRSSAQVERQRAGYDWLDKLTIAAAIALWLAALYPNSWPWA